MMVMRTSTISMRRLVQVHDRLAWMEEECVCEEEEKREMTEELELEVNRFAHQAIARMLCPSRRGALRRRPRDWR
jgi:hypothetical protein